MKRISMKKAFPILTALLLVITAVVCGLPTAAVEENEVISIDFDDMSGGSVPNGWSNNYNNSDIYARVVAGSRTQPPKGLRVYDHSTTAGPERVYCKFDPISGAAEVSFGYFLGSIGANSAHEFILFNGVNDTAHIKLAVSFFPNGDGTAVCKYYAASRQYVTSAYNTAPLFAWNNVKITITADNKATVSVNGAIVASNVDCIAENASFDRVCFLTWNRAGAGDTYWIDDLKVVAGSNTVIDEKFENTAIGALPAGWVTENNSADIGAYVDGFYNALGNYLEVADKSSALGPISSQLKVEKTNLSSLSFSYSPITTDSSGVDVIKISNGGVAYNNCLIELQVFHNGTNLNELKYYIHNPKETVDTGIKLKQNSWYRFRVEMPKNFNNENAKLYVNDAYICDIPLRNTGSYAVYDTIAFESWNARGVNTFYIDDVRLERYTLEDVMTETLSRLNAGRFVFNMTAGDLGAVRMSLLSDGVSALTVESDSQGALYWKRGEKLIKFAPEGTLKANVSQKIEIDMPDGRNVDYFKVYVDGEYAGMALYDNAFDTVDNFLLSAEIGAGVTASGFEVGASAGVYEREETEKASVEVYLPEIVDARVGYKENDTAPANGALGNFDSGINLPVLATRNSIGVDTGKAQKLNAIRIATTSSEKISVNTTDFSIWYSNDNVAYTKLKGFSLNSFTENGVMTLLFEFSGVEARYFKINTGKTDAAITLEAALGTVRAERKIARQYPMAGQIMEKLGDSSPESGAMTRVFTQKKLTLANGDSLGINFGVNSHVEAVELKGSGAENIGYGDVELYYSNDNVTYVKIASPIISYGESSVRFSFESIKCGYVKLNIIGEDVSVSTSHSDISAYSSVEVESGFSSYVAGVSRGAEGSFTTLPDGTMLMTYNHPTDLSAAVTDNSPMAIFTVKSYDGGYTWDKANTYLTIPVPEGAVNVGQSTYLWMENGDLAIVYRTIEIAQQQKNVYIQRSDDGGVTWGDPVRVTDWDEKLYSVLSSGNRCYRLPNGRLLVAVNQDSDYNDAWGGDRAVSVIWYSDDDGYTWTRSKDVVTVPTAALEPNLALLPDGSLLMSVRTRNVGRIYQSVSYDNGVTWTQAEMVTDDSEDGYLDSPSSTNALLTLPTGDVALFWNNVWSNANEPRTPLSVGITVDNGESYTNVRNLVETTGGSAQWPYVAAYGRGVYVQLGFGITSVKIADISELYAPVSGNKTVNDLPAAATPTAVYDETTRTLSGLDSDTVYSLDGGESWIFAGGSSVTFEQSHVAKTREILVKNIGNTAYAPSDIQALKAHEFEGDTCKVCGVACAHEWNGGLCIYCGNGCAHSLEFSVYSGVCVCTECGEICAHDWTSGACADCGLVCVHDWKYFDGTSTCAICQKTCTDHSKLGIDFKCAECGRDVGAVNSFNKGASLLYDNSCTLESYHSASIGFDFTVDSARYDNSTEPNNKSDFHSLLTLIRDTNGGMEYHVFASLWMDQESGKLYLTKVNDAKTKICEIELGAKYEAKVEFEPKNGGAYTVTIMRDGNALGSFNSNFAVFGETVKPSSLRFGEAVNAKYLRVEKISFENIEISTLPYENGVCAKCGEECAHSYNIGGYCKICGVLGNPITFGDGKNGGGNIVDTVKNAQPLTVGDGVYSQNNGSYQQCWDYRDTEGLLLGNDYVFAGKFTFNEWTHEPKDGETRLLIWADGDVNSDNTRFAISLYTDSGKLEMGVSSNERVALELGREYDLRVVVRPTKMADGKYLNRAEVYLNGEILWINAFTISGENGLGIRLGDHVMRTSRVKYDVKNDLGIYFLDNSIEYIGAQEKENANYNFDTSFDMRFVFGLDDLYLEDVGVKVDVRMIDGDILGSAGGEVTRSSSRKVLEEVLAGGVVCKPVVNGAGGGGYYLALAVKDIALDTTATYKFTLTPYVRLHKADAVSFMPYSYEITVNFVDNQMKIDFAEIR